MPSIPGILTSTDLSLAHNEPELYLPHYLPLSADLAELRLWNNPVDFVPVVRTSVNHARRSAGRRKSVLRPHAVIL